MTVVLLPRDRAIQKKLLGWDCILYFFIAGSRVIRYYNRPQQAQLYRWACLQASGGRLGLALGFEGPQPLLQLTEMHFLIFIRNKSSGIRNFLAFGQHTIVVINCQKKSVKKSKNVNKRILKYRQMCFFSFLNRIKLSFYITVKNIFFANRFVCANIF